MLASNAGNRNLLVVLMKPVILLSPAPSKLVIPLAAIGPIRATVPWIANA